MRSRIRRGPPWGAASGTVAAALLAGSAVAWAQAKFTANGVTCDVSTSYDTMALSPSDFGAIDFRLNTIFTLKTRHKRLTTPRILVPGSADSGDSGPPALSACSPQGRDTGVPGCAEVAAWNSRREENPWPTPSDPYYIYLRSLYTAEDGSMASESVRALAHERCLGLATTAQVDIGRVGDAGPIQYFNQCGQLVAMEEEADPSLKAQLQAAVQYLRDPHASAERESSKSDAGRSAEKDAGRRDEIRRGEMESALGPDAGGGGADLRDSSRRTYVFYECLEQALAKDQYGAKTEPFCMTHTGPSQPFLWHRQWPTATPEIVDAASQVPSDEPAYEISAVDPSSEEAALEANFVPCHNATFYVTPTHELVRHGVDRVIDEHFTVCVDTAGFAVDQAIEVAITTPAAQQIEWLWPGEPKAIHLEMSDQTKAQVVHLTIGGYPRRELLRAVSHNSGGPLQQKDIFEFIEEARQGEADKPKLAGAQGLANFAKVILANKDSVRALLALSDEVDRAQRNTEPAPSIAVLRTATQSALKRIGDLADSLPQDQRKALDDLLPTKEQIDGALEIDYLLPQALKVVQLVRVLSGGGSASAGASAASSAKSTSGGDGGVDQAVAARELCAIADEVVPLVSEDLIVRGRTGTEDPYILEYDFGGGFQLSSGRPLSDKDTLFVVVRNVQPSWSVGVSIDNRAVVHRDTTLVGLPAAAPASPGVHFDQRTGESRPGFDALRPLDREMQPPSTQILPLGRLSGSAQYDITVCASDSPNDDCTQPGTPTSNSKPASMSAGSTESADAGTDGGKGGATASAGTSPEAAMPHHRTIAKNTVTVHSKQFLGVRAGFGGVGLIGRFQDVVAYPEVSGSVIRAQAGQADFALPLLVAAYPEGRDPLSLALTPSWGVVAGLDLLKIGPDFRLYAGPTFDFGPVGLTVMGSAARVPYVVGPQGTILTSPYQTDTVWRLGLAGAATFDFDIFQAAFQNLFKAPQFPMATPARSP